MTDFKKDAQDYAYDAMETWGSPEGDTALNEALKLDPELPDALWLQSSAIDDPDEEHDLLLKALVSAESRLGKSFEKKYAGLFWGDIDTRPFMRILASLAENAERRDSRSETIQIYERMIKLNPNDNQGVRYPLICLYLAERRLNKAQKLLDCYEGEDSAWFSWSRALLAFVQKDRPKATRLLKKARAQNPFVELYLSGQKQPEYLPEFYSHGDESEAICAFFDLVEPWSRRQNALLWLGGQLSGDSDYVR
jgi:tetratricopeptide (TPR) repeat protein